ncbi:MAG: hypothetical protein K0S28_1994 [Paucimonas sp.]|jgi:uncharacterized membrane protein YsdA (DUF1294 family)|nr:hypothetical protein [Paucimonas sp.]
MVALLFVAALTAAAAYSHVSWFLPAWYGLAAGITFIAYALDKSAARRRAQRIPERVLHVLSLAGGWPGAFVAQSALRHKSAKRAFLVTCWMTALLNCAMLALFIFVQNKASGWLIF